MTAAVVTAPLDVLKTRRQALIMSLSQPDKISSMALLTRIVRTEGPSALFAGNIPRIAKIAPACGIMIACFEVRYAFTKLLYPLLNCPLPGHWQTVG